LYVTCGFPSEGALLATIEAVAPPPLPDLLATDLVAVFVGTSVSTTSAEEKH